MTGERNTDRAIRAWLADDVDILPDRVLDAVVAELPVTRQERRHLGWLPPVEPVRLVAIAAVLVAAVAVGLAVVASPGRVGTPAPTAPLAAPSLPIASSPVSTPTPTVAPSDTPGYGSAPPGWPTNGPLAPASPLPSPDGDPLPADLVGREYNTDPLDYRLAQALVLTLRPADDPHCVAMYDGASTCFTILWTPNYPYHASDKAVRGPARMVDGNLVLTFALVPDDPGCEGTSSTYAVSEDGWTLTGTDVPPCSFRGFVRH